MSTPGYGLSNVNALLAPATRHQRAWALLAGIRIAEDVLYYYCEKCGRLYFEETSPKRGVEIFHVSCAGAYDVGCRSLDAGALNVGMLIHVALLALHEEASS